MNLPSPKKVKKKSFSVFIYFFSVGYNEPLISHSIIIYF